MAPQILLSKDALLFNIRLITNACPGKELCAIVKSNAYGHGIKEIIKMLCNNVKCQSVGVDTIEEAIKVRKQGWEKQIFLLAQEIRITSMIKCIKLKCTVYINSLDNLKRVLIIAGYLKKKIMISIECETGMNRLGIEENDIDKALEIIKKYKEFVDLQYLGTHCGRVDDSVENKEMLEAQKNIFTEIKNKFKSFFPNIKTHAFATGGMFSFKHNEFDMVRCGSALYGLWKNNEFKEKHQGSSVFLNQVIKITAGIIHIKEVKKGEWIGYGEAFQAPLNMKIAILDIGYAHGLPRAISNKYSVLINKKPAPICGWISMGMTCVDITHIEKVTLRTRAIITDNIKNFDALAIGNACNIPSYSFTAGLSALIKRKIVK